MFDRSQIQEGMMVHSADGNKLGRVFAIAHMEFFIEKGIFFPKDYACRYSDIADIRNGEIFLNVRRDSLRRTSEVSAYPEEVPPKAGLGGISPAFRTVKKVEHAGMGVQEPAKGAQPPGLSAQEPEVEARQRAVVGEEAVSRKEEEEELERVSEPPRHEEAELRGAKGAGEERKLDFSSDTDMPRKE